MNKQESKKSHPFKALLFKNITLQKRQPLTSICTIITPIICILFTTVIQKAIFSVLPDQSQTFISKYPYFPFHLNDYTIMDQFYQFVNRSPLNWYQYQILDESSKQYFGTNDGKSKPSGMLQYIPKPSMYDHCSFNSSFTPPFTVEKVSCLFLRNVTKNHTLNQQLFQTYLYLNSVDYTTNRKNSYLDKLPDGGITVYKANNKKLSASLKINDLRVLEYHRCDGITEIGLRYNITYGSKYQYYYTITEGMLSLADMLNIAYIRNLTNRTISSGFIYMPINSQFKVFIEIIINTVSTILFPLSLSLLFPVFLYNIVLEKEQKLIQMMRMNGMGIGQYWFNNFIFNFILSLLTNLLFCLFGYFFMDNGIFYQTSWVLIAVVLVGWILAQIGMSVFFQVFLSNSRAASIIGYLLSIWTNLIGATFSVALYQYPTQLPIGLSLYPTFAFNRIFYIFFSECSQDHCVESISNLSPQLQRCIITLYVSAALFFLIGMYLFEIVPQQYGVQQPILFPITKIKEYFTKRQQLTINSDNMQYELAHKNKNNKLNKDSLAIEETNKIRRIDNLADYSLVCSNLRKVYDNGKVAVDGLNLAVSNNQIFGLLGPNGAGKTTLISMITGVFPPTNGNAYIGGYSILNEIDLVHLNMGVCPQFDILWPQLTVEEHLYFYARLKGIQPKHEQQMVKAAMQEVNLLNFKTFRSKQLSGGMKRRLSVGISLVGNPKIVFLDQPTTGLDPQNRRQLWEVMSKLRLKRSLFLTTHLMEEANTLCNRIGIITEGHLRTVGTQFQIKKLYGKDLASSQSRHQTYSEYSQDQEDDYGQNKESVISQQQSVRFNMTILDQQKQANAKKMLNIKETIFQSFPNCKIDRQINGFLRFCLGQIVVSEVLTKISQLQSKQIRDGWAISNSNLEDIFIQVVNKFQKNKEQDMELNQNSQQNIIEGRVSIQYQRFQDDDNQ